MRQRLTVREQAKLARAPKLADRALDGLGKAWTLPNTALGLVLGGAGYAAGYASQLLPGDHHAPRVRIGHNAVEFINNPVAPLGAVTLGNSTIYGEDPYDSRDPYWAKYRTKRGHSFQEHERAHTVQAQQLGPFYIPSNLAGGLLAVVKDGDWHGPSNWNERGPGMRTPRPWPQTR
jgi:hypothetical protein